MRDLVSGTMPYILVMSGVFSGKVCDVSSAFEVKEHFFSWLSGILKKSWLIVPTVVLVVVYTGFGLWF